MPLKIDLHVHTTYSKDSFITPDMVVRVARSADLDGVAITDHDSIKAHKKLGQTPNLVVIPGVEVSSQHGHILALGVTEPVEKGLTALETVERTRDLGGIVVIPHPNRLFKRNISRSIFRQIKPDAVETVNASTLLPSTFKKTQTLAQEENLPQTGGSDAHIPEMVGRAYTLINVDGTDVESILNAIKRGKTSPTGRRMSIKDLIRRLELQAERKLGLIALPPAD